MVAARLRAPHGVRVAHRDVGAGGDVHTGAQDLEDIKQSNSRIKKYTKMSINFTNISLGCWKS